MIKLMVNDADRQKHQIDQSVSLSAIEANLRGGLLPLTTFGFYNREDRVFTETISSDTFDQIMTEFIRFLIGHD